MTSTPPSPRWRHALHRHTLLAVWRRGRQPLAWVVGIYVVVLLLLAIAVPWVVQGPVLSAAAKALERPVTLQSARFNPFKLSLTLNGLRVQDAAPSAQDFITVQRIVVDLSLSSLWRLAPVLDHLHVQAPHIALARAANGRLNVSDLIEKFAAPGASSPADPHAAPARFALHDVMLQNGELRFDDAVQDTHHVLQHIELSVPSVASFQGDWDTAVKPLLSAQVHGGELKLGAETKPFKATRETTLHLTLQGLRLADALKGLPALAPWHVAQGTLDTQWQLTLRAAEDAAMGEEKKNATAPPPQSGLHMVAKAQVQLHQVAFVSPQGDQISLDDGRFGSDQLTVALDHPDGPQWQLDDALLQMKSLQWRDSPQGAPVVALASMSVTQADADSTRHAATLKHLQWDGLQVQAHRDAQGHLNLLSLLDRLPGQAAQPPAATTPKPVTSPSPAWTVDIDRIELAHTGAHWHDEASKPVVQGGIKNLRGHAEAVSTRTAGTVPFQLDTEFEHGGALALQGTAHTEQRQLAAELKITALNLALAQPYLAQVLNLQLSKGQLDTQGQLTVDAPAQGDLRVAFKGQSSIDGLYTREPDTQEDFLRWKRLSISDLDLSVAPTALSAKDHIHIGGLAFQDLFAKIVINPNGRLNLQEILRSSNASPPPSANQASAPAAASANTDTPQVSLGGIVIKGGQLNFSDQFVKPNYTVRLTDLSGTVSAVGPKSPPAQLDLKGRVEGDAPITIEGRVNPVGASLFVDVIAKARGIDLPTLSTYSTKYAGYPIKRGKLSLDVAYKIENGQLQAQNGIFLDKLTFGERVDSPTATQLPVLFAVSLLKNSRGEIDLHLPISGSLSDPQFSIGSVLASAVGNLLTRAVTAPFSLLASVIGGDEGAGQLGVVDFFPGTATLTPEAAPRLKKLSQALVERPALKLDITPRVDPVAELGDMRRARLLARVRAERKQHDPSFTPPSEDEIEEGVVDPSIRDPARWKEGEYAQWLQRVYDGTSVANKPRNAIGVSKKISVADMESLLMAASVVDDNDFRALAQRRARTVRRVLNEQQVSSERVFTLSPTIEAGPQREPGTPAPEEGSCVSACAALALH